MSVFDLPRLHFAGTATLRLPTGPRSGLVDLAAHRVLTDDGPFPAGRPAADYHAFLHRRGPRYDAEGRPDPDGPFSAALGWDFAGSGHFALDARVVAVETGDAPAAHGSAGDGPTAADTRTEGARVADGRAADGRAVRSGSDGGGDGPDSDPLVGSSVDVWGHYNPYLRTTVNRARVLDLDPASRWTTALAVGRFAVGRRGRSHDGPYAFTGAVHGVHPPRWVDLDHVRDVGDHVLAPQFRYAAVHQFVVAADDLDLPPGAAASPAAAALCAAAARTGGVVVQLALDNMAAPPPSGAPARWRVRGTAAPWHADELRSYPAGRLLVPRPGAPLHHMTVRVADGRAVLNTVTALRYASRARRPGPGPLHRLGPPLGAGDLELRTAATDRLVARVPERAYLHGDGPGVVCVPAAAGGVRAAAGEGLRLVGAGPSGERRTLLVEREVNVQSDEALPVLHHRDRRRGRDHAVRVPVRSYVRGRPAAVPRIRVRQHHNPRALPADPVAGGPAARVGDAVLLGVGDGAGGYGPTGTFATDARGDGVLVLRGERAGTCRVLLSAEPDTGAEAAGTADGAEAGEGAEAADGAGAGDDGAAAADGPRAGDGAGVADGAGTADGVEAVDGADPPGARDAPAAAPRVDPAAPGSAWAAYDDGDALGFWAGAGALAVRVLPDDWHLDDVPRAAVDFDLVHREVFAYYEHTSAFMRAEVFSLADRCKAETYAALIAQTCDPAVRDRTYAMPPTRDLSAPKARLLLAYSRNLRSGEPPGRAAPACAAPAPAAAPAVPATRGELLAALRQAAALELAVMLQYLYAAYSLPTYATGLRRVRAGRWTPRQLELCCGDGGATLRDGIRGSLLGVAREEMIHFLLVNNIVMATGEPFHLPDVDFATINDRLPVPLDLALEPLTAGSVQRFAAIEQPAPPGPPARSAAPPRGPDGRPRFTWGTISELYAGIREGLRRVPDLFLVERGRGGGEHHLFLRRSLERAHPDYQLEVDDLASALFAVDVITEQGEGGTAPWTDTPTRGAPAAAPTAVDPAADDPTSADPAAADPAAEVAHFHTFLRIGELLADERSPGPYGRRVPWTPAHPVLRNPTLRPGDGVRTELTDPHARTVAGLFNRAHHLTLQLMAQHFGGSPDASLRRSPLMNASIDMMTGVLRPIAEVLVTLDSGRPGRTAGPTFELDAPPAPSARPDVARRALAVRLRHLAAAAAACPSVPDHAVGMLRFHADAFDREDT